MNREQAKALIRNVFENKFNKDTFVVFIKNLLNEIEDKRFIYQGNYIPDAFKPYITSLERIGKYNDGKNEIDILIVKLQRKSFLERARTRQRNFIAWYLKGSRGGKLKDAALVAFVSPDEENWRFSLVKMDYRYEETPSGNVKIKEEFTPARRWSFLVGRGEKSHTAQSRFVPILEDDAHKPTLAQLEEAFNIEPVTKEFFNKYRDLLIRTVDALDNIVEKDPVIRKDFESKNINTVDFAKKLLGQIVFLYFLQKKGWFGVPRDGEWGSGPKDFMRRLFKKEYGDYSNFFNDILEPLFYEALARERDDDFYSRFNCKIPFLNGGLFEPIGRYDWVHTDILLPNELFSNNRLTHEGDIGDGILDVFDRFNFTVKEDEPLEKEVAIDPELLGKLYEKFNAIRPDNFYEYKKALASGKRSLEKQFNKKFGVYYTPREIVHYMCQQSLIYYLSSELEGKVSKEDIEILIKHGEQLIENEIIAEIKEQRIKEGKQKTSDYEHKLPESIRKNAKIIDEKLRDIKICDPAIGSGAFPVGMMHEIVKTRNVLSTFIKEPGRSTYNFKRECIENSLYGVDIDAGACEVAKLRLWLSLIVDEEDIREIKPLPNLDYKIVCGNSLLGVEKDLFNKDLFNQLEKLKPLYFNETNPGKKQEYKNQIEELISKITKGRKEFDFEVYFSEVFHEKGGFDVVIGNPPYQGFRDMDKKIKVLLQKNYVATKGKFDLYIPFIEKSYQILRKDGFFIFICPTAFTKREHGKHLRKFLLSNVSLNELVDFGHSQVFDYATNYTGIFSFVKTNKRKKFIYRKGFSEKSLVLTQADLSDESWIFTDEISKAIIDKIQKNHLLGQISIISEGVVTGLNELYLKTHREVDELGLEMEYFFPIYRGKEIERYYLHKNSELLFYPYILKNQKTVPISESILKTRFPNVFSYLRRHLYLINRRAYFVSSNKKWYELWNPRDMSYFLEDKIITPELSDKNRFAIAPPKTFYGDTVCGIVINNHFNKQLKLKYLLAVLNSKLIEWYYKKSTVPKAGGFFIYKVMYLKSIPVKIGSKSEQKKFIDIVNKILSITQSEDYLENPQKRAKVKEYECQIDQLVYKLYGLTDEEIKIVEGEVDGKE